jgi:hypothetical protein
MKEITLTELLAITKGRDALNKRILKLADRAMRLEEAVGLLAVDLRALVRADNKPVAPKEKKPRQPTVATQEQCDKVLILLAPDSNWTTKNIATVTELGLKTTGAALRLLEANGKAVEKGGKWRLPKSGGAGE